MDDLKKLSVERLRELARKHLGKGHSRLRTKAQLLEALRSALRELVPRARAKVRVVDFPPGRKVRVRAERAAAAADAAAAAAAPDPDGGAPRPVIATRRARAPAPAAPSRSARPATNGAPDGSTRAAPPVPVEAPVEEGFFEAPTTPRRLHRTPAHLEPFEPGPFASPREVGTDAPLLLVRDPTTLFAFWDFRRELERGAALGLREPRLLLRLFRGADLDRSLELPLSSRSTYVTGLSSGQEYTAEVLLLGRDGWTRPVGSRSAPRRLPPGRVSAQLEVRTLRLPWSEPLSEAPAPSAASAPRLEPLDSPRRVPLPTSPGARGPGDRSGSSGGSRSGRN